jgi:hypothetical protein
MRMRGWLGGVVLVAGMGAGSAGAVVPIDPTTLVGAWSGTWENKSFKPHPTGTVAATVAVPDANTVVVTYSATGGVFGQCAVDETTLTLVRDVDFTDTSLDFPRQDATFGAVTVESKKKGKRLVASGTGTCGGGGPSWRAKGKYKAPTLAVKMKIKLPGKTAKTSITVTKL